MAAAGKKKFTVVTAQGTEVEVTATRAEEDESGTVVRFFDGDDPVGSFRSFGSYRLSD